jgi:hypothetical protein
MMLRNGITALLLVGASVPAIAQAQDNPNPSPGDLVMRRPLPFGRVASTQDDCTTTGTCPAGEVKTAYVAANIGCLNGESQSRLVCLGVRVMMPYDGSEPESDEADMSQCGAQSAGDPTYQQLLGMVPPGMVVAPAEVASFTPTSCGATPTPPPTTPTPPTPVPTTPTPSTQDGGFGHDPAKIVDHPKDPKYPAFVTWVPGPWQGTGQCGEKADLSRTVSCIGAYYGRGMEVGRVDSGPVYASSGGETGLQQSIRGVQQDNPWRMTAVQMGGPPNMYEYRQTSANECAMRLGPPPPTTYDGKNAACPTTIKEGAWGDWTNQYGQDVACSSSSTRSKLIQCVDGGGQPVDMEYCFNDLRPGGQADYALQDNYIEYGRFDGCTAEWKEQASYQGCDGPSEIEAVSHYCERSDGEYLGGVKEAACGPKPAIDGTTRVIGSCFEGRYSNVGRCTGYVKKKLMELPNGTGSPSSYDYQNGTYYWAGSDACLPEACCSMTYDNQKQAYILYAMFGDFVSGSGYTRMFEGDLGTYVYYSTLPKQWIPSYNRNPR